jgi:biopolymer transport protein ExbD
MKTALFIVLLALTLARPVFASGPPDIFISTGETGVSYRLVDWNRRSEKEAKTLEEAAAWSSDRVKEGTGDVFMIYPDGRTSFKTVLDLLRRLKSAGVKHFSIGTAEVREGVEGLHYLLIKAETIKSLPGRATPPPK